jgi:hypothetical protein
MILRNLLLLTSILLLIGWALGVFVWKHQGWVIHLLAVIAFISLFVGLTRKREPDI